MTMERKLQKVYIRAENSIKQFEDLPIVPKFELLKAYALKQTKGIEAFKEAIDFVALSYPNTEEGKHAIELLADIKSSTSSEKNTDAVTPKKTNPTPPGNKKN